jgi:ABC-type transport system involved in multi-copper enzyme maturation permease subunit
MKRLLSIEFQKTWGNRAGRILIISYFVLLSFIALIASVKFNIGTFKLHIAEHGIFNFPYIWHFNTYVAAILKFFLAIVIVSMMANEYTYGTLKQNLIDGLSKKEFILSKFIAVVLFALGSTVFVFLMSLALGLSFSSYTEFDIVFTDLEYLIAYFVKLTAFFSFCLFLGILIKRSAFALGFLLVWYMFEGIAKGFLSFWFFPNNPKMASTISGFLPLESMSNLIVEPITRLSVIKTLENSIGGPVAAKDYGVPLMGLLIVVGWIVIFLLSSYKLLQKRDL